MHRIQGASPARLRSEVVTPEGAAVIITRSGTPLRHSCGTSTTANRAVGVLSKMFTLAEAWELTPPGSNPCRGLRRYRMRQCERFLTPAEFRRLGCALDEAEAKGGASAPAVAAIRLLMLTGCRKSEILDLRWEDHHPLVHGRVGRSLP